MRNYLTLKQIICNHHRQFVGLKCFISSDADCCASSCNLMCPGFKKSVRDFHFICTMVMPLQDYVLIISALHKMAIQKNVLEYNNLYLMSQLVYVLLQTE